MLLAVPVCAPDTAAVLREEVDELVCLETPEWFFGVGQFYKDFHRVADAEVGDLLHRVTPAVPARAGAIDDDPPIRDEEVAIPVGMVRLAESG